MKHLYTLTFFVLLPLLLTAQQEGDKWISLGTSLQGVALQREYTRQIGSGFDDFNDAPMLFSPGFQLGYSWRLRPRWEISLRANYTQASAIDKRDFRFSASRIAGMFPRPEGRLASHKSFWAEGFFLKSLFRRYTRLDLQFGLGLSYIRYEQNYRTSFFSDQITGAFGAETIREESIAKWGFPLLLQMQCPLGSRVRLEAQIGGNVFLNGSSQIGFSLSGAYRLNN